MKAVLASGAQENRGKFGEGSGRIVIVPEEPLIEVGKAKETLCLFQGSRPWPLWIHLHLLTFQYVTQKRNGDNMNLTLLSFYSQFVIRVSLWSIGWHCGLKARRSWFQTPAFLCGVCMFSLCPCGFPLGAPVSPPSKTF